MISEVVKDTSYSWLESPNMKRKWMALEDPNVPMYKILSFWNEGKGVKNPIFLYFMIPEVVKYTRSSRLELHNL